MKRIIHTETAPKAVGPYSQAVEKAGILFVSGQIPLSPETGELIKGDIAEQTKMVLTNIDGILKAAGYNRDDVMKCTCLLDNIADFKEMNKVYEEYFFENPPARAAYEVVNLPLGAKIEIEAIAIK
ncbi:MAG: RidA family protein [Bacteroidales bacterium]|nr:RidA family protein [Bacteroidales bacterium]